MEFLLPLLNPNFHNNVNSAGFGPGYGFRTNSCQDGPCSSAQAQARQEQQQNEPFNFQEFISTAAANYGINLEDTLSTAAAFVASLAEAQNKSSASSGERKNFCSKGQKQCGQQPCNIGNDNEFKVKFDVGQFKPEELNVKAVDNFIILEGAHEEREDGYGLVSRTFKRRIAIPVGTDSSKISCAFTADGQLVISAPRLAPVQPEQVEKSIPIQVTKDTVGSVSSDNMETDGQATTSSNTGIPK